MTVGELVAIGGGIIGLLTVVGGIIVRDRALIAMFTAMVQTARDEADKECKTLHDRINRVRDEYTRRSDLDQHVASMQTSLQSLAGEVRTHTAQTNQRLDALVAALIKRDGAP